MKLFNRQTQASFIKKSTLAAGFGFFTVFTLQASAAEPINLIQAYELALENDARIAGATASYKANLELLPQGRAALLPSISLSANAFNNSSTNIGKKNQPDTNKDWNNNTWSANIRQPLFNLEAWFAYSQVGSLTDQAKTNLSAEQQNLILRVAAAYFDVLRADDALATVKAQEKAVKRQMDQTRQRFEVGLIAETDVFEARAAYDDARVLRIEAANQVEVALENMRSIINTPVRRIAQLNKNMPVKLPAPQDSESWVKTAIAQNYQLAGARLSIDAAGYQLNATRSRHAPTVSAVASYTGQDDENAVTPIMTGKSNSTVYGIEMTMPIFSGGATSAQVRESGYRKEEVENLYDETLRTVTADARNLFRTVNTDSDRIEARCRGIISARSALKATQSGYQVGIRNIVDVLEAQKSFYAAQSDYLNARYDFIINTLKLKQTAGTLSPDDLKSLNKWVTNDQKADRIPACN